MSGLDKTYTISELAREFDVTTRTIRHYEDQGLIAPERRGQPGQQVEAFERLSLRLARLGERIRITGQRGIGQELLHLYQLVAGFRQGTHQRCGDCLGQPDVVTDHLQLLDGHAGQNVQQDQAGADENAQAGTQAQGRTGHDGLRQLGYAQSIVRAAYHASLAGRKAPSGARP